MKKSLWVLLILVMSVSLLPLTSTVFAGSNEIFLYVGSVSASVNGNIAAIDESTEIVPYIKNGRTMIPIRFLSEKLGYTVDFSSADMSAKITQNGNTVFVFEGKSEISVNGKTIAIDATAEIKNNRMFVPIRAVTEATGYKVDYKKGLVLISNGADKISDEVYIDVTAKISPVKRIANQEQLDEFFPKLSEQNGYYAGGAVDYSALTDNAEKRSITSSGIGGGGGASAPMPSAVPEAARDTNAKNSVMEFSQTNNQIEGVDESDIIKTDGENIFILSMGKVKILKADPLSVLTEIVPENDSFNPIDLFIDDGKLIIIGNEWENIQSDETVNAKMMPAPGGVGAVYRPYYINKNYLKIYVYGVSDPKNPVLERETNIEGNYVTSRKIGKHIYFVSNKWAYQADGIMPLIRENKAEIACPVTDLCYFPGFSDNNVVTVSSINVDNSDERLVTETFLGGSQNVFVSENNLYIAVRASGKDSDYYQNTDVYRFSLSNGEIFLSGKGSVDGTVLNQFSMDEYDGHFRIATNAMIKNSNGTGMTNQLYVLDQAMTVCGSILDIAPNERIYSTRFLGKKGYMVTFRQVDPFFAIDLSDHNNPKIMGELKIPGYSDYLHPYDENTIIGFGKEANDDGFTKGMKISVFDVSDFANPKEMFKETIGDRGTSSDVLYNHKALLTNKSTGLFAFPVDLYEVKNGGTYSYQGFYVYKLDKASGFTKIGTISHITDEDLREGKQYMNRIERAIYIGDKIYTMSQSKMFENDINTLEKLAEASWEIE